MDARYTAYLLSDSWQQRRIGCFSRAGNQCEVCGERSKLQCHHLTYARIFNEPLEDLMALCDPHHDAIEKLFKEGMVLKTGDPNQLRKNTLELLHSSIKIDGAVYEFLPKNWTPQVIQEKLLQQGPFLALLGKQPKQFKRLVREMFKSHPFRHKILANAHVIYQKSDHPKPYLMPTGPAPKPLSDHEKLLSFTKEFGQLLRKYSNANKGALVREILKLTADILPK